MHLHHVLIAVLRLRAPSCVRQEDGRVGVSTMLGWLKAQNPCFVFAFNQLLMPLELPLFS